LPPRARSSASPCSGERRAARRERRKRAAKVRAETPHAPLVHDRDVGKRDRLADPPAELAPVAPGDAVACKLVVGARAGAQPRGARARRALHGKDEHLGSPRVRLEGGHLGRAASAVDHGGLRPRRDDSERPAGPDVGPVPRALLACNAPHMLRRKRQPARGDLFADAVAHRVDGQARGPRDGDGDRLPRAGHARDEDEPQRHDPGGSNARGKKKRSRPNEWAAEPPLWPTYLRGKGLPASR
jgi:hypothetical protein